LRKRVTRINLAPNHEKNIVIIILAALSIVLGLSAFAQVKADQAAVG